MFFNDTPTTDIYTLSLHDALPIGRSRSPSQAAANASPRRAPSVASTGCSGVRCGAARARREETGTTGTPRACARSEEHTSELQSRQYLVCRLLLQKKKNRRVLRLL